MEYEYIQQGVAYIKKKKETSIWTTGGQTNDMQFANYNHHLLLLTGSDTELCKPCQGSSCL